MKLVLIFGNSAVGKMTVGRELSKITNLKLFHNHMMIEPVLEIFDAFNVNAIKQLREVIFNEFIKTEQEGMIFTFMWALDRMEDHEYVQSITNIFDKVNSEIYYVELVATLEERLKRNQQLSRLTEKPSKRDIKASTERLLRDDSKYRLESVEGEFRGKNHIKIDNTNINAADVSAMIKKKFDL